MQKKVKVTIYEYEPNWALLRAKPVTSQIPQKVVSVDEALYAHYLNTLLEFEHLYHRLTHKKGIYYGSLNR